MIQNSQSKKNQLDMKKIKDILLSDKNESLCCALLQALRWRITKTPNGLVRRSYVIQFVSNDFLNYSFMASLLEKRGQKVTQVQPDQRIHYKVDRCTRF